MNCRIVLSVFIIFTALSSNAWAEPPATLPLAPTLQIIEDDQARAFRFMIDGKEVAVLDSNGFHVQGNIDYSGAITDAGPAPVNQSVTTEGDLAR